MNPLEILTAAKALIDTPEKWTQNVYARNDKNAPIYVADPTACRFCSQGALYRVAGYDPYGFKGGSAADAAEDLLLAAATELAGATFNHLKWNDTHCHANVMKMWDLAITKAKEAQ